MRKYQSARLRLAAAFGPERITLPMDLLERIETILENKGWSAREWCRRAGLKEISHLTSLMGRLRENPEATMDLRTAAKLADAAHVSLDWLALGRGSPEGAVVLAEPDPRYPSRGVAVAAARIFGYGLDAIARVQSVDSFAQDPGKEYWLAALRAEHEAGARPAPPPKGRPKKRVPTR